MERFEYKVIPAPEKGKKVRGLRKPGDRFAAAVEEILSEMGAEGWEYLRADCLPSVERAGIASSKTVERHLLVFRRSVIEPERPSAFSSLRATPREEAEPARSLRVEPRLSARPHDEGDDALPQAEGPRGEARD